MSASSPLDAPPSTGSHVTSAVDATAQTREQLKQRAMHGGMTATDGGFAPRASHPGLREQPHRNIHVEQPAGKEMSITHSRRRYIDPHENTHNNPLYHRSEDHISDINNNNNRNNCKDDAKENVASAVGHGAGQSAPLLSVRPEVSPVPRTRSHDTASESNAPRGRSNSLSSSPSSHAHTRHVSAEYDMSKTSIERAEARLRALLQQQPAPPQVSNINRNNADVPVSSEATNEPSREMTDIREAAAALLRDYAGDPAIVTAEEKLRHRIAVNAYAAQCRQSSSQRRPSAPTRGRSLGTVSPALQRSLPYAVDDAAATMAPTRSGSRPASECTTAGEDAHTSVTARPPYDTVDYYHSRGDDTQTTKTKTTTAQTCTDSVHTSDSSSISSNNKNDNLGVSGKTSQANLGVSAAASTICMYPSPPTVGLTTQRHALVHIDRSRNACSAPLCSEDTDTLALKRARSRTPTPPPVSAHCSEADDNTAARVTEQSGEVAPSLRNTVEARWKAREEQQQTQRKGRAFVPHEEHETRPW